MQDKGDAIIRVGTLCLLLSDHTLSGRFCVVAGPLTYVKGTHRATGRPRAGDAYPLDVPSEKAGVWFSFPRHLLPLAPPKPEHDEAMAECESVRA